MKSRKPVDIARVFDDGRRIDAAVQRAVSAARQRHKQAGRPVAEWRDGKVVWIPAEQIEEAKPERPKSARKGKDRASARAPKRAPKKPAPGSRRG